MGFGCDVRMIRIGRHCTGGLLKFDPARSATTPCSYVTRISPMSFTAEVVNAAIIVDSDCSLADLQIVISGLCL